MRKIYFAGAIRGGRDDREIYMQIISYLRNFGEVLTEHVGDDALTPTGETGLSDKEIYDRDMAWLTAADVVVAEVSTPSIGVGFEIASAIGMKKNVLCLFRTGGTRRLSAMIAGCGEVTVNHYSTVEEIQDILSRFFKDVNI